MREKKKKQLKIRNNFIWKLSEVNKSRCRNDNNNNNKTKNGNLIILFGIIQFTASIRKFVRRYRKKDKEEIQGKQYLIK